MAGAFGVISSEMSSSKLRCIEFFSGIGGWSRAIDLFSTSTSSTIEVCRAYDVNPNANIVYEHNYPHMKVSTRSIVNLTAREVDALEADIWVMSPPCQPFTRNNETDSRDCKDNRSDALINLIHILQETQQPPMYVALENVVGFETSDCCNLLLKALETVGYEYQQYQLTPTQFGIPNERPRYYLIASLMHKEAKSSQHVNFQNSLQSPYSGRKIRCSLWDNQEERATGLRVANYINDVIEPDLIIDDDTLSKKSSWCFDIVHPDHYRTSCFTKSYSRYSKGTGSVLLVDEISHNDDSRNMVSDPRQAQIVCKRKQTAVNGDESNDDSSLLGELSKTPEERSFRTDWVNLLKNAKKSLRYFSSSELLSLFAFNEPTEHSATTDALSKLDYAHKQSFEFPMEISRRKQYELLGNSVNVCVVGHLLMKLLQPSTDT